MNQVLADISRDDAVVIEAKVSTKPPAAKPEEAKKDK